MVDCTNCTEAQKHRRPEGVLLIWLSRASHWPFRPPPWPLWPPPWPFEPSTRPFRTPPWPFRMPSRPPCAPFRCRLVEAFGAQSPDPPGLRSDPPGLRPDPSGLRPMSSQPSREVSVTKCPARSSSRTRCSHSVLPASSGLLGGFVEAFVLQKPQPCHECLKIPTLRRAASINPRQTNNCAGVGAPLSPERSSAAARPGQRPQPAIANFQEPAQSPQQARQASNTLGGTACLAYSTGSAVCAEAAWISNPSSSSEFVRSSLDPPHRNAETT